MHDPTAPVLPAGAGTPTGARRVAGAPARLLALLLAAALPATPAAASDRGGPARTGVFAGAALREAPQLAWAAKLGFRDWGHAVRAGGLVIASNATGVGGLFALDERTGALRWKQGKEQAHWSPVSDGHVVIAAYHTFPQALAAYDVASGKPLWRLPFEHVQQSRPALVDGVLYATGRNGSFYAFDAATGAERWHFTFAEKPAACGSLPVVDRGTVYFTGGGDGVHDKSKGNFVFALDAATGRERWRFQAEAKYEWAGVCVREIVLAGDTLVASGFFNLYGIAAADGRAQWAVEVPDGAKRAEVHGLVVADGALWGVTEHFLGAFDPASGRTLWQLPGAYRVVTPATAVADHVLYFQGQVAGRDDAAPGGVLYALDLRRRELLWSWFWPPTAGWHFGDLLPADGAIYVDTENALLKLNGPS